jgi:hypothetical protein
MTLDQMTPDQIGSRLERLQQEYRTLEGTRRPSREARLFRVAAEMGALQMQLNAIRRSEMATGQRWSDATQARQRVRELRQSAEAAKSDTRLAMTDLESLLALAQVYVDTRSVVDQAWTPDGTPPVDLDIRYLRERGQTAADPSAKDWWSAALNAAMEYRTRWRDWVEALAALVGYVPVMDDVRVRLLEERAAQLEQEAVAMDTALAAFRVVDSAQEVVTEYMQEFGGLLRLEE